jgi:hypothetical protein
MESQTPNVFGLRVARLVRIVNKPFGRLWKVELKVALVAWQSYMDLISTPKRVVTIPA